MSKIPKSKELVSTDSSDEGETEKKVTKEEKEEEKEWKPSKKSKREVSSDEEESDEEVTKKKPSKKSKRKSSSDEEESDEEVTKKKPKKKKKKSEGDDGSSKKKLDGEEPYWELSRMRRVSVSSFKGRRLINIREYYEKDGKLLPGRKGISLSQDQWKTLCNSVDEINEEL